MSNRRKSFFEVNHVVQAEQRQQEESLSNEIDQNLRTLVLLRPFSENARPLLIKGAFLKVNRPAFHYVIQYLVMIISSVDFRKRFRWPINTSKDEGDFRNATLSYINECHSNFKWNIGPFKMQVVHFPGGIEFMKVIVELSKTAMLKILKDSGSLHFMNIKAITLHEAKAKLKADEEAFKELELIQRKIRDLSANVVEKTNHLQEMLRDISANTAVPPILFEQSSLLAWQEDQHKEVDKIWQSVQVLEEFSSTCDSIEKKLMDAKPQHMCFDKDKMNAAGLLRMSEHFNPQIDYEKLMTFFMNIMPDLLNSLHFKPPWSIMQLKLESQVLEKYLKRAHSMLLRLDAIIMDLPVIANRTNTSTQAVGNMVRYWHEMVMLTPIINRPTKTVNRHKAIWDSMVVDSPVRTKPSVDSPARMAISDDTSGFADGFGLVDTTSMQPASTKLDPMAMLSCAMHRNKGANRNSPRQTSRLSSPVGLVGNNKPAFSSTMIQPGSPRPHNNQTNFSSIRKILF